MFSVCLTGSRVEAAPPCSGSGPAKLLPERSPQHRPPELQLGLSLCALCLLLLWPLLLLYVSAVFVLCCLVDSVGYLVV